MAHELGLAQWKFSWRGMARLEGGWLGGKHSFLFPVHRAVVRDRKKAAGGGALGFLVAEPGGLVVAAHLCAVPARLGLHLREPVQLDTLYPQPDDPS